MFLFRRFLVILMRRLAEFSSAQQLIVPVVLAGVIEAWRFGTGRITLASIRRNPLDEVFPAIATAGLIVIYQIAMAARDLNRQLLHEAENKRPTIIHPENIFRKPSKVPPVAIAFLLACFVVLGEGLILEHAYPVEAISFTIPSPGPPPDLRANAKGELKELSFVRCQPMPYKIGGTFEVHMYVDNKTEKTLRVVGYSRSELVDNPPNDYNDRKRLEDGLWSKLRIKASRLPTLNIPIAQPGSFWIRFDTGTPLSKDDIDKLGTTESVYFTARIQDASSGRRLLDSCFRTVPNSEALMLCIDHNR